MPHPPLYPSTGAFYPSTGTSSANAFWVDVSCGTGSPHTQITFPWWYQGTTIANAYRPVFPQTVCTPQPPTWWYQNATNQVSAAQTYLVVNEAVTEEQRAEHRRQARLDDLASKRAKALLLEHLTDQQRHEYENSGYFHVLGQSGKVYRIRRGIAGNVYEIGHDGSQVHKFCIHATDRLPQEDHMLSQLLLLRFDESRFMATANRHW